METATRTRQVVVGELNGLKVSYVPFKTGALRKVLREGKDDPGALLDWMENEVIVRIQDQEGAFVEFDDLDLSDAGIVMKAVMEGVGLGKGPVGVS